MCVPDMSPPGFWEQPDAGPDTVSSHSANLQGMNPVQTLAAQSTGSLHGALSGCGVAVVSPHDPAEGSLPAGRTLLSDGRGLPVSCARAWHWLSVQSSVFQGLKSWDA